MVTRMLLLIISFFLITNNSNSQWEKANGGKELPDSTSIFAILTNGNTIITATSNGIYFSSNNGENWTKKNTGLETQAEVKTLGMKGSKYFVGTMEGIYSSTDNCESWNVSDNGINSESVYCFLVYGNNIYAGTTAGVFVSSDNGNNWISKSNGIPEFESVYSLALKGNTIFAGTSVGVYGSASNGDSWIGKNFEEIVSSITVNKNNIYISGDGVNTGLHKSTDNGSSWSKINSGIDISHSTKFFLLSVGDSVFAGGIRTGVYVTNDNGNSWLQFNDGLSAYVQGNETMLASNEKYIFVGSMGASGYCNLWRHRRYEKDTTGIDDLDAESKMFQVFPNPAVDMFSVIADLPEDNIISISVIDVIGNEFFIQKSNPVNKGMNKFTFSTDRFQNGTYYIKLKTSHYSYIRKIVILK
jgi:photosystem II stability/assembly factor-like uncharacterized protein